MSSVYKCSFLCSVCEMVILYDTIYFKLGCYLKAWWGSRRVWRRPADLVVAPLTRELNLIYGGRGRVVVGKHNKDSLGPRCKAKLIKSYLLCLVRWPFSSFIPRRLYPRKGGRRSFFWVHSDSQEISIFKLETIYYSKSHLRPVFERKANFDDSEEENLLYRGKAIKMRNEYFDTVSRT